MSDLEIRVVKLEGKAETHDTEIDEIRRENRRLDTTLSSLEKTLEQIKNVVVGAVGFWVLQNVGLMEFIKKVIL